MPLITHVLKAHERIIIEYHIKNTVTDRGSGIFVRYTSDSLYAFAAVRRRPSKPRFFGLVSRSSTEKSSYVTISARELI